MSPEARMIVTAALSAITSSGVMSLVIYLLQRRDKRKEKEEANNSAQSRMLLGLGHDRIIYLTEKYVRRGVITLKEKRNLKYLCDPYFDLGGNGDCVVGYEACQKLDVVSDADAEAMDLRHTRREYTNEIE